MFEKIKRPMQPALTLNGAEVDASEAAIELAFDTGLEDRTAMLVNRKRRGAFHDRHTNQHRKEKATGREKEGNGGGRKMRMIIGITALAFYGIAGTLQRGWTDWLGIAAVGLLVAAIAITTKEVSADDE